MYKGYDLSSVQGKLTLEHYQQMVMNGISFIIVKSCTGNDGVDPYFTRNIALAQQAGLKVACYNFIYPLNDDGIHKGRDPISQAQMHFKACQNQPLVFVDAEWPPPEQFSKWGVSPQSITNWLRLYLKEYERLSGRKPLIYTYPYWAAAVNLPQEFAEYSLWIASYEKTPRIPKPWADWVIWQNTGGGGKLPNGAPVDTNLAKDLSLWDIYYSAPAYTQPPQQPANAYVPPSSTSNAVVIPELTLPSTHIEQSQSSNTMHDSGTNNVVQQSNTQRMIQPPSQNNGTSFFDKVSNILKIILPKIFHI